MRQGGKGKKMKGIDTKARLDEYLEELERINRLEKIDFCGRYLGASSTHNVADPMELYELYNNGFHVVGIHGDTSHGEEYFAKDRYRHDLLEISEIRKRYRIPVNGCVYIPVDYDAGPENWGGIREYFKNIEMGVRLNDELRKAYQLGGFGVMGSGYVCSQVKREHPNIRTWVIHKDDWRPPMTRKFKPDIERVDCVRETSFPVNWDIALKDCGAWKLNVAKFV